MTFREITSGEILAALGDGGKDPVLRACVAALRAYPRPSYAIGGSPASTVRETLEVKYRRAASRGKSFIGDGELLLQLQELRNEPVAVVSAHAPGKNFYVYVTPSALEPVGAVIMYDAQRDEVAGDLPQCELAIHRPRHVARIRFRGPLAGPIGECSQILDSEQWRGGAFIISTELIRIQLLSGRLWSFGT
jgi:hypothetical protein